MTARYGDERGDWADDLTATWGREVIEYTPEGRTYEPVIVLPHQCDEWVIGTESEARALIADLERLIEKGPEGDLRVVY